MLKTQETLFCGDDLRLELAEEFLLDIMELNSHGLMQFLAFEPYLA